MKAVSWSSATDARIENYHTFRKFAEILNLLPLSSLTTETIELIPLWLRSRYDRGLVASELDKGLLRKLISSDEKAYWEKAIKVLSYCTAIQVPESTDPGKTSTDLKSVVDDYLLKQLLSNHLSSLAKKLPAEIVDLFLLRTREVYTTSVPVRSSWLVRPAVEDNPQNHSWDGIENRVVEGLRDALEVWTDVDTESAKNRISLLLEDEAEMVRRIALYMLNRRWDELNGLFPQVIGTRLFQLATLHESYDLISSRFADLEVGLQRAVFESLRAYVQNLGARDEPHAKYVARQWLSAMRERGSPEADQWFAELNDDPTMAPLTEHPSFNVYMESWSAGQARRRIAPRNSLSSHRTRR